MPLPWRSWLLGQGSLTQRLVTASGGDFRVEILAQALRRPLAEERAALGLPERQVALVREVLLRGRGEPWVYARSVVPLAVLRGRYGFLRHLGTRPLGALLFRDAGIRRGTIEVTQRTPPRCLSKTPDEPLAWVRRSVFYLDQQPLLVAEMFLPGFRH
ncbi:MAG: chorismate lyase [Porticoccaceae bacterium]